MSVCVCVCLGLWKSRRCRLWNWAERQQSHLFDIPSPNRGMTSVRISRWCSLWLLYCTLSANTCAALTHWHVILCIVDIGLPWFTNCVLETHLDWYWPSRARELRAMWKSCDVQSAPHIGIESRIAFRYGLFFTFSFILHLVNGFALKWFINDLRIWAQVMYLAIFLNSETHSTSLWLFLN